MRNLSQSPEPVLSMDLDVDQNIMIAGCTPCTLRSYKLSCSQHHQRAAVNEGDVSLMQSLFEFG